MGVLQRFERRLGGLVEGTFARVFGGYVQPVEVAAALTREAQDKKAIVGAGRVLVPNSYVVELGDADLDRLTEYDAPLRRELAAMVSESAVEQGWSFVGPVEVRLERTAGLGTGVFRVRSSVVAGPPTGGFPTPVAPGPPVTPAAVTPAAVTPAAGPAVSPAASPVAGAPVVAPVPAAPPAPRVVPLVVQRPAPKTAPAPPAHGGPHLVVMGHGPAAAELARTVPLTGTVVVIGRGAEADVQLTDTGVSRRHAELHLTDPPEIVDTGSTNGTRLNAKAISRSTLQDGDRIGVGTSELVFRTGERV